MYEQEFRGLTATILRINFKVSLHACKCNRIKSSIYIHMSKQVIKLLQTIMQTCNYATDTAIYIIYIAH